MAPRNTFPEIGERGCAFFFTDAVREDFGGFTIVLEAGAERALFLYMAETWERATLDLLQEDVLSMPAGECYGAVMLADAVIRRLDGVTHIWCFTDSVATRSAITTVAAAVLLSYTTFCRGSVVRSRRFSSWRSMSPEYGTTLWRIS